jgi:hypothetical protein
MSDLNLHPNFGAEADAFYAELIAAQAGLSDDAAADWMARLTLILCNHIGDRQVLRQAFALARESSETATHDLPSVPPHAPR